MYNLPTAAVAVAIMGFYIWALHWVGQVQLLHGQTLVPTGDILYSQTEFG